MNQHLTLITLIANNGHRTRTAEQLGISVRTLRNYLNDFRREGIDVIEPEHNSKSAHARNLIEQLEDSKGTIEDYKGFASNAERLYYLDTGARLRRTEEEYA